METAGNFFEDWIKKWKQELSWQERWDVNGWHKEDDTNVKLDVDYWNRDDDEYAKPVKAARRAAKARILKKAIEGGTVLDLDKIMEPGHINKLFGCNIALRGGIGSMLIHGTDIIGYKINPTHFNFTYGDASTIISFEEINELKKEDVLKLFETRVNKMKNDWLFPDDN